MENNNQNNPEEVGKMIGAAVNEVLSSQPNVENNNSDSNSNSDSDSNDNVRLTKDGKPDGRQVSPIRGGRDPEKDSND